MPELPTGTVTFLFTDVEGSTKLWERYPEAMGANMARHDELLRGVMESSGGFVFARGFWSLQNLCKWQFFSKNSLL
jgi:class 3 adenylate cyclase